jgi:hypothetical protein
VTVARFSLSCILALWLVASAPLHAATLRAVGLDQPISAATPFDVRLEVVGDDATIATWPDFTEALPGWRVFAQREDERSVTLTLASDLPGPRPFPALEVPVIDRSVAPMTVAFRTRRSLSPWWAFCCSSSASSG